MQWLHTVQCLYIALSVKLLLGQILQEVLSAPTLQDDPTLSAEPTTPDNLTLLTSYSPLTDVSHCEQTEMERSTEETECDIDFSQVHYSHIGIQVALVIKNARIQTSPWCFFVGKCGVFRSNQ